MLATVCSAAVSGIEAYPVEVEVGERIMQGIEKLHWVYQWSAGFQFQRSGGNLLATSRSV
jgi:hypothetical protein